MINLLWRRPTSQRGGRVRLFALALLASTVLSGCLTAERAKLPGTEPGTHVLVRNYGKFLLDLVPIGCGNASENPSCGFVMFRNDVTMDKMNHRFYAECRKAGNGDVTDVVCHAEHNIMLEIPIWSFNIPIPYLWTTREIQLSGIVH